MEFATTLSQPGFEGPGGIGSELSQLSSNYLYVSAERNKFLDFVNKAVLYLREGSWMLRPDTDFIKVLLEIIPEENFIDLIPGKEITDQVKKLTLARNSGEDSIKDSYFVIFVPMDLDPFQRSVAEVIAQNAGNVLVVDLM